jgi:hypothetical protein
MTPVIAMLMLRTRHVLRTLPRAIMLAAAMAVVFHGAVSVLAHPIAVAAPTHHIVETKTHRHLTADRHLNAQSHVADHADSADHGQQPIGPRHASHDHGKVIGQGDCCSAVSAVTLPAPIAARLHFGTAGPIRLVNAIASVGQDPAAPTKPPRPTYQC